MALEPAVLVLRALGIVQISSLGPTLMCSSHSQYSPASAYYARCQSHPSVPCRNEVKIDKPASA